MLGIVKFLSSGFKGVWVWVSECFRPCSSDPFKKASVPGAAGSTQSNPYEHRKLLLLRYLAAAFDLQTTLKAASLNCLCNNEG